MVHPETWTELWDRGQDLIKYQVTSTAVHERLYKFLIEFAKLQLEAFAAQKKLCEKYAIDTEKYFGTKNTFGAAVNEFLRVTQLLVDTEGLVASSYELHGGGDVKHAIKSERHAMKRWKNERDKLVSEMKTQTRIIDDEIKRYRDKYRDMVKANEEYTRIEADISHSQNDVTKALTTAQTKTTEFDRARRDYQAALHQFNLYRNDHFNRTLPYWAHAGYQMTKDRYARIQNLFAALCERIRVMAERLNTVSVELHNLSDTLNVDQDTEQLISRLRTGNPFPGDVAFVDLATTYPTPAPVPVDSDTHREKSSTMNIYATPNLPSNFYPSISAADLAALESAGLTRVKIDEAVYSGTGSLYSTVSAIITNGTTRRPSVTTSSLHSPPHNAGILRRLFSRRSHHDLSRQNTTEHDGKEFSRRNQPLFESAKPWRRQKKRSLRRKSTTREPDIALVSSLRTTQSTGNLAASKHATQGRQCSDEKADLPDNQLKSPQVRRFLDLLDSSDFSDSSFESDKDDTTNVNHYAQSPVQVRQDGGDKPLPLPKHIAPLAQPETSSYACSMVGVPHTNSTQYNGRSSNTTQDLADEPPKTNVHKLNATCDRPDSPQIANRPNSLSTNQRPETGANIGPTNAPSAKPTRVPMRPPPISLPRASLPDVDSNSQKSDTSSVVRNKPSSVVPEIDTYDVQLRARRPVNIVQPHSTANSPKRENSVTSTSSRIAVYDRRTDHSSHEDSTKHFFPRKPHPRFNPVQDTAIVVGECTALYDFAADGFESCYLPFQEGDKFYLLAPSVSEDTSEWIRVIRFDKHESGYVPTAFMEQKRYPQPVLFPTGVGEARSSSCAPSPVHCASTASVQSRSSHSAVSSPTACYKQSRNLRALYGNQLAGSSRGTDL